jgi:hypothetical protein
MAPSLIFLGVDLFTLNWYFVIYLLFSIAVVGLGVSKLYTMGTATAIIYAIGSIMILVFYSYRWFGIDTTSSPTWPPTINTCPDYFTYIASLPGDSKPGCVDLLGVSKNSGIQKSTAAQLGVGGALTSTSVDKVFPYTSKDVLKATTSAVVNGICQYCNSKGITWEGVYDGDTCIGVSNNAALKSSASGSCPK